MILNDSKNKLNFYKHMYIGFLNDQKKFFPLKLKIIFRRYANENFEIYNLSFNFKWYLFCNLPTIR